MAFNAHPPRSLTAPTQRRRGRHANYALPLFWCAFVVLAIDAPRVGAEVWISDLVEPRLSLAPEPSIDSLIDWEAVLSADPAQFQQPVVPRVEAPPPIPQSATSDRASQQFWSSFGEGRTPSFAASGAPPTGSSFISGQESVIRATTDMGDLMGSSPKALNLGLQRRNPIVNDPRIRGSRVGAMAASGSYWVPARIDLDTMVSKIDSRIVDNVIVVGGPYTALYGPGLQFVDFELLRAPRYGPDFEVHGITSLDYRANGEQWFGRQTALGGNDAWGFRVGYGLSTGSDYVDGAGQSIPSSFKSRDLDVAVGAQLTPDSTLDAQALRLDQNDVELAGQAFDIDWLVTDGYEIDYRLANSSWAEQVTFQTWYNQTVFNGNAQNPSKRQQFPYLNAIDFVGFTDVDSMSTGYRLVSEWPGANEERLQAGADLRYIKQELNEYSSGEIAGEPWTNANSPIPKSDSANPGLFVEASTGSVEAVQAKAGARLDYVRTAVLANQAQLSDLGVQSKLPGATPLSAQDIWGSDQLSEGDAVGLIFTSFEAKLDDGWGAGFKVGYGERAPNLTERYVVESFMDLIQNGLNTVTGDPTLEKERSFQFDAGVSRQVGDFRWEANFFHAWIQDYITFEAMSSATGPPDGQIEQLNLKYVNTQLATIWGWEAIAEYKWNPLLTPFATLKYVQGEDLTRDGTFATHQAEGGLPSYRVAGLPRGYFGNDGATLSNEEPLPGILPLESRLGLRWEESQSPVRWGLEVYTRIVDDQERVAASLLESATPGFTTWNLSGFLRPSERLTIVGGVENFTNKQYQEHLDYRSRNPLALSTFRAGVTFYCGAELNY